MIQYISARIKNTLERVQVSNSEVTSFPTTAFSAIPLTSAFSPDTLKISLRIFHLFV